MASTYEMEDFMKKNRLLDIFLQLIKIEALSQHEKPVADHIHDFLTALNLKPYFDKSNIKTKSNTGNLLCKVGSGGDIMF
jgi:di/tripeptidase